MQINIWRNIAKENNTEICWVNNKDNKKIKKNQKIQLGTYEIQLFNTTDQIQGKKVKNKDGQEVAINDNVNTITALATSNGKSVYFAGDIGNYSGINAGTEAAEQASKALNGQPVDVYKVAHHSRGGHNNSEKEIDLLKPKSSVATMAKKRIDSGDKDFKAADDRIREYTNGKSYYTTAGTVVMNIGTYGDLTLKQMPNYWTSAGKKVGKDTKKTTRFHCIFRYL